MGISVDNDGVFWCPLESDSIGSNVSTSTAWGVREISSCGMLYWGTEYNSTGAAIGRYDATVMFDELDSRMQVRLEQQNMSGAKVSQEDISFIWSVTTESLQSTNFSASAWSGNCSGQGKILRLRNAAGNILELAAGNIVELAPTAKASGTKGADKGFWEFLAVIMAVTFLLGLYQYYTMFCKSRHSNQVAVKMYQATVPPVSYE